MGIGNEILFDRCENDLRGARFGEAEDARRDGREGNRFKTQCIRQAQRASHRGGKFGVFVAFPPHRPDGVDHIAAREIPPARVGRFGVTYAAMFPHPAIRFGLNSLSTAPNDDARHAAAMLQLGVGGIDDRIHILLGEIASSDLKTPPGGVYAFAHHKVIVTTQPNGEVPEKRVCERKAGCAPFAHPFFGLIRSMAEQLQVIVAFTQMVVNARNRKPGLCEKPGFLGISSMTLDSRFGLFDDCGKCLGIAHRQVGQHLAVEFDLCLLHGMDETAVGHAIPAGSRVDAGNP